MKLGLLPRIAAWEILQAVGRGAYCDVAIERAFRKHDLSVIDRAFVIELASGAVRQRARLDAWIDLLATITAVKQPPLLRWLFHVGLYQIFYMDKIPVSAAVNTSVEIAKINNLGRLSKVVNAVLRRAIIASENGEELPTLKGFSEEFAQRYSLPIWLAKEVLEWRGKEDADAFAKASNHVPKIDLRVNCRRASLGNVKEKLEKAGITSEVIKDSCQGLTVISGSGDLRTWPGYKEGEWSVQDRSAQWISPLVLPQSGESILDACAAPGGKTTHLAELMDDVGEVWAIDSSAKRLERVSQSANRLGLRSIQFLSADCSALLDQMPSWEGYFHRILLDVPCSCLGTLARHPDLRWRMSSKRIKELLELQSRILRGVVPLLKPGGRIVYSTCTVNPDENFRQIDEFLSLHQNLRLDMQKQIWPGDPQGGDGFYAATINSL